MTAILPALLGSILVILVLAALIRPLLKSRPVKKPLAERALFRFNEEYSVELTDPVKPLNEEMVPELPRSYGIDRMILLVRDPYWLYAYWEITATKMDEISAAYGPEIWDASSAVLRVYDVTGVEFNGSNANSLYDYSLNNADEWYINVPSSNRSYCVDLGRLLPDGRFITLLRSNTVTTPRDSLSDSLDEEWMWIEGLYYRHQLGISSPLIIEEISERMGKLPLGISSPGFNNPHEQ